MTRNLFIAALLLLAGCGQQDQPAAPVSNDAAQAAPAPAAKPPVPSLKGDWRVTAITGAPTAGSMTAVIGDGRVSVSAGCLRRAWTYTQDRNSVDFAASPATSSDCGRLPSADEDVAFGAIEDANLAIFGKDGGDVTLSGPGGTLTLERR